MSKQRDELEMQRVPVGGKESPAESGYVDLSRRIITEDELVQLKPRRPTGMRLDGVILPTSGLSRFSDFELLESIDLRAAEISTPDGRGRFVQDVDLDYLANLTALHFIDLSWSECTGRGIAKLKRLTKLATLYFIRVKLTDDDMVHLEHLPLRYVSMEGTQITARGLRILLIDHELMNSIDVSNTAITPAEVDEIVAYYGKHGRRLTIHNCRASNS